MVFNERRRASPAISSASASVLPSGHSQRTALPDCNPVMTSSRCPGTRTTTTRRSISRCAAMSSNRWNASSAPNAAAEALAVSSCAVQTAFSSYPGSAFRAGTCAFCPQLLPPCVTVAPTIPTRILSIMAGSHRARYWTWPPAARLRDRESQLRLVFSGFAHSWTKPTVPRATSAAPAEDRMRPVGEDRDSRVGRRVHHRNVAGGDRIDRRARCEDGDPTARRPGSRPRIALRRPRPERSTPDEQSGLGVGAGHEGAVGKLADVGAVSARAAVRAEAVAMKLPIEERYAGGGADAAVGVADGPRVLEARVVGVPTFSAGPVTRRQRGCLIQEEQLRVAARRHHPPPAPLEAEHTGHPGAVAASEWPDDPTRLVVKATAVAHQASPGGAGDDVSSRGHTVLQRHCPGFYTVQPW